MEANMDRSRISGGRGAGRMHTQQNNRAGLLPRLQIKPHTGPLLRQLLQDGGLMVGQTARKNSCPTFRERETVGAAANIWPQARRSSRTGAAAATERLKRTVWCKKRSRGGEKKKVGSRDFHRDSLGFVALNLNTIIM